MKISVMTGGTEEVVGTDSAYRLIAEAGFDAVDVNTDRLWSSKNIQAKIIPEIFMPGKTEQDLIEFCRPWGDAAKKYGLENYQCHGIYQGQLMGEEEDPEYDDFVLEAIRRNIVAAASIDCRNIIVHPFFKKYEFAYTPEEEYERNIERYSKLIPTAKQYGVTINLENMFTTYKDKRYAAVCNYAPEAVKYVDTLNDIAGDRVFAFCLDTGHTLLVGRDIKQFIVTLGDRINCFHVHDNDGIIDSHRVPYTGKLDWERFIAGLKEIRFNKTMSFETFMSMSRVPEALFPAVLRYLADCGRYFAKRVEEA